MGWTLTKNWGLSHDRSGEFFSSSVYRLAVEFLQAFSQLHIGDSFLQIKLAKLRSCEDLPYLLSSLRLYGTVLLHFMLFLTKCGDNFTSSEGKIMWCDVRIWPKSVIWSKHISVWWILKKHDPLLFTEWGSKIRCEKQKSMNNLLPFGQKQCFSIFRFSLHIAIGATCFFTSTVWLEDLIELSSSFYTAMLCRVWVMCVCSWGDPVNLRSHSKRAKFQGRVYRTFFI